MPTFEVLPLELRHQIMTFAFDDTMYEKDLRFNFLVREYLWDGTNRRSRLLGKYNLPDSLEEVLKKHNDKSWYATHVYRLAPNLCTFFPGLKDNVVFILEKS